ncbi:ATP-binding response regulator [Noviherbaspirillum aridicola]|uniref:histidine kinase n=1 Tax=Noviherbaspirillum aridicola TaxID=2849687 RepID=A0ABQ4PZD2_9BURK|nr:ATP-binding protein [Noviherbaspirillum aridicola]GIZ50265.1 hybrid sensor histidine kinase/response regulator [Noviherbaspirillum aridicola]
MQTSVGSFFQRLIQSRAAASGKLSSAGRRVKLELLLQRGSPARTLYSLPFATSMLAIFYMHRPSAAIVAWCAILYLLKGFNYLETRKLNERGPIEDHELAPMLARRTVYLFVFGCYWGATPWVVMPFDEPGYVALMSTFIVAAISTGAAMLASHRRTTAVFILPAGLGLISALVWAGGVVQWILALGLAQFLAIILKWTFQQAHLLEEALNVRFEKEDLARRLAQQVALVEEANREKSRFLASASHDLRQPLHAISLFTSVLQRSETDPARAQTVDQLGNSVAMLSQSLDAMLDVSRLDAGAVQPRLEALSVHELFMSLHTTFAGRAQEKGLQLRLRAPGDLAVLSDPQLLERLLGNLIDNALKYTERGGVLVAARVQAAGKDERVRFEIVDTGIGIPQQYHDLVFDEFYQLGNPERDRRRGLGIGLSIVKRLSELLAHPVALDSQPGRGTRFRVWVPRANVHAGRGGTCGAGQRQDMPFHGALPAHVLVLDDEPDSREALASLLRSYGCEVLTAASVEHAERLWRQQAVDAVVADFRLPGERSGLDFLLQVRADTPNVRTLLVTGETAPQRIAAIKASGVPCLFKPVLAQRLLDALAA